MYIITINPRNRLSVRECLEHKWLQLTDKIVKDREDTVFLTNTLAKFVADYDAVRQAEDFRQDFQAHILPIQMSKAIPFEMTTADVSKPVSKGKISQKVQISTAFARRVRCQVNCRFL